MRLIPFLTALIVMAVLAVAVLYRDALVQFAQTPPWETPAADSAPVAEDTAVAAETEETEAEGAPETKAALISVVAVLSTAQQVDSALVLRGETEAARTVDVRAETSSTVISEPLRKGSFITKGTLMCALDPGTRAASVAEAAARLAEAKARVPETQARIPEAEARIPEAEARIPESEARLLEAGARLDEAQVNYNAALKLQEDGFASETRLKNAEAAVRSAEAGVIAAEASVKSALAGVKTAASGLEAARSGVDSVLASIQSAEASVAAAQKEMDNLKIHAPFDGILESDTAELGALLQPGSLCGTVLQLDPIKLVGFVPETDVSRVQLGAAAGARLATGEQIAGAVSFLARSGDSQTRTFRVEVEVPNPDLNIRDGQTAEIVIAAEGTRAHLLPQSALTLDDEGRLGVRIVNSVDEAEFAEVRLLRDTREGVWLAGLPEEVRVITLGQEYVTDGVPVNVTLASSEEASQ